MDDGPISPPFRPLPTETPAEPRTGWPWWAWLLLVMPVIALAAVALIVAAGVFFWLTAQELPIEEDDRELVVHVDRVAPWLEDFQPDRAAESLSKRRYLDRSVELEYEYEHPHEDRSLYVYFSVSRERRQQDASGAFAVMDATARASGRFSEARMVFVPADDLLRWGDASRCCLLQVGGAPVGNYFAARKGRSLFFLMIVGVYFTEEEDFRALVVPVLERAAAARLE